MSRKRRRRAPDPHVHGWHAHLLWARQNHCWDSSYRAYTNSGQWKRTRREALLRAGGRCVLCGSSHRLEVHHVNYANVGRELPADLRVLCRGCHKAHHQTHPALTQRIPLDAATRALLEAKAVAATVPTTPERKRLHGVRRIPLARPSS